VNLAQSRHGDSGPSSEPLRQTCQVEEAVTPILHIDGLLARPVELTREDLVQLPRAELEESYVCEEGWTVPTLRWAGVRLSDVLTLVQPLPTARFVRAGSGTWVVPVDLDSTGATLIVGVSVATVGVDFSPTASPMLAALLFVIFVAACLGLGLAGASTFFLLEVKEGSEPISWTTTLMARVVSGVYYPLRALFLVAVLVAALEMILRGLGIG
jgi:hypothetical protein